MVHNSNKKKKITSHTHKQKVYSRKLQKGKVCTSNSMRQKKKVETNLGRNSVKIEKGGGVQVIAPTKHTTLGCCSFRITSICRRKYKGATLICASECIKHMHIVIVAHFRFEQI
jgi:hypothetical protein